MAGKKKRSKRSVVRGGRTPRARQARPAFYDTERRYRRPSFRFALDELATVLARLHPRAFDAIIFEHFARIRDAGISFGAYRHIPPDYRGVYPLRAPYPGTRRPIITFEIGVKTNLSTGRTDILAWRKG